MPKESKDSPLYPVAEYNQWIEPVKHGFKFRCCSCSLIHAMDFRIVKHGKVQFVEFRCRRDNRATAAARRGKGIVIPHED